MATKVNFLAYLESLNLFRWDITETKTGFEATISERTVPNLNNFTQVNRNDDGTWWVRLSKQDVNNQNITGGFFG